MACQGLLKGLETVGIDPKSRGGVGFENKEREELEEILFPGDGVFVPPIVCSIAGYAIPIQRSVSTGRHVILWDR